MLLQRVIGVFKLDAATFEDIEADESATSQAAIVVLIIALISGIGNAVLAGFSEGSIIGGFLTSLITAFIGWLVWSAITYFVGTTFFGGTATFREMLRVIGFAYAPQVLSIIPCIGWLIGVIWTAAAIFVAIRQSLDIDNTKSCLTIIVGIIAYFIILVIVGSIFGGSLLALGALSG